MTVKEYNKKFSPLLDNAKVFINAIDHAMQKTDDYKGAVKQLACIGWGDECKNTILAALDVYDDSVRGQLT